MECSHALATEHVVGEPSFALLQYLTHTADRCKSRFQRGFQAASQLIAVSNGLLDDLLGMVQA